MPGGLRYYSIMLSAIRDAFADTLLTAAAREGEPNGIVLVSLCPFRAVAESMNAHREQSIRTPGTQRTGRLRRLYFRVRRPPAYSARGSCRQVQVQLTRPREQGTDQSTGVAPPADPWRCHCCSTADAGSAP